MKLFKADFYRSFGIGFVLGAALVFTTLSGHPADSVVPPAEAAPAR